MKTLINYFFFTFCFALMAFTHVQAQKFKVGIVPIGKLNPDHLEMAKKSLETFYYTKVTTSAARLPIDNNLLSTFPANKAAVKSTVTVQVLNTDSTNIRLSQLGLSKYDVIIGITDSAITIGKELWVSNMQGLNKFLMEGVAQSNLKTATISTYKLKKEAKDAQAFQEDLVKVIRHEMAHLLGVPHCGKSEHCLMLGAYQFKNATVNFCQSCFEKIDKKYLKRRI